MSWAIGDWLWHSDYLRHASCQIVDVQPLWGQIAYHVWLSHPDTVVHVPVHRLEPLAAHHAYALPYHLTYVAATARIADALTQDLLLAPVTSSVVPLPHQTRALPRTISGDRVGICSPRK